MFKKTFFVIFAILLSQNSFSQSNNICDKWDILDSMIVNSTIDPDDASDLMIAYEPEIRKYFRQQKGVQINKDNWSFPLSNYTSIYFRDSGNDYKDTGYDYFQGSNTKGHPAHDIMILDVNKDLLDDSTLKPVDVVSMSGGVVVATDTTWAPGSLLRGGKYVKIFDVTNNGLFYYSHLSQVNVKPGDIVVNGEKIGEVGRTGRKAILKDGKTHLHVAYLKFEDGYPMPYDIIMDLRKTENSNNSNK
ncbi:MAG TPA: M23 family metallopeptidase [Ignavibacteria bacterium]|nr:M23 family metallopeptidase [Ignavibacteria bacterium]